MLVIISDLHLTDGSTTATLSAESWQVFEERMRDLALLASWRADGKYRPLERIDLVLLGDTLDLMRTATWLESAARPWTSSASPDLARPLDQIVTDTLQQNEYGLDILRNLAVEGSIALPPATQSGHPVSAGEAVPVHVRIHYMVGDQDWPLHLPGSQYDAIRKKICRQLGLATPPDQPFPHEPAESPELLHALRRHRVLARHGDQFCPLSWAGDRDRSTLSDTIAIQLGVQFLVEVDQRMGQDVPAGMIAAMNELVHLRPLTLTPWWLDSFLHRSGLAAAARSQVKRIWDQLVDELLQLPPAMDARADSGHELIDGLAGALKFGQRPRGGAIGPNDGWLNQLRGSADDSFACHALTEQDFRNRRARHVVYGHTHQAETVALDASCADGFVLNQVYFNAGTWRRSYQPTRWAAGIAGHVGAEYVGMEHLHLLAFYQGDERSGRTFETSSSWMAPRPLAATQHRLDTTAEPASSHPEPVRRPMSAPHFHPSLPDVPANATRY